MAIYYVDPSTGDDTTGDGSSGSPWKTIQHALDNGTWATTTGNTLRLANTTAAVLTSPIDFDTSVALGEAPLCIEGWDNGGSITATGPWGSTISPCGEINGNDAVAYVCDANTRYVTFKNLKIHSTTSYVLSLSTSTEIINCEVYNGGTLRTITAGGSSSFYNSYVHTDQTTGEVIYAAATIIGCEIAGGGNGIRLTGTNGVCSRNLIYGGTGSGIVFGFDHQIVSNNTIDGSDASDGGIGIEINSANVEHSVIFNNLVANFSGVGSKGVSIVTGAPCSLLGNNSFYNCTTDEDAPTPACDLANITESSDPFTDSSTGDYSLVTGANSIGAAMFTNADPDNPDNIGAWQDYSSGAGGGGGSGGRARAFSY
jgi:hypothetical protein